MNQEVSYVQKKHTLVVVAYSGYTEEKISFILLR